MSVSGTQAIDRAAALLSLVVYADHPCSYGDLVAETGLARSTASRLLAALERHHLLGRDATGAYHPGSLFAVHAARHEPTEALVHAAGPVLDEVNRGTGETVNLAVPSGEGVVQVAQVDSTFRLAVSNWVGVNVPAHCSALGKVLYAFEAIPPPRGRLERRTARTAGTSDELAAQLHEIRQDGFAYTHGELEEGLDGVAAPVRGRDGRVLASLGVSGPSFRMVDSLTEIAALVVSQSDRLSFDMGYRPDHAAHPRSTRRQQQ